MKFSRIKRKERHLASIKPRRQRTHFHRTQSLARYDQNRKLRSPLTRQKSRRLHARPLTKLSSRVRRTTLRIRPYS